MGRNDNEFIDLSKSIDLDEKMLTIRYNTLGRIWAILIRITIILCLCFFLFLGNFITSIIVIFSVALLIWGLFCIVFFDNLTFTENCIINTLNIFGKPIMFSLNYSYIGVSVSKNYFGGSLMFWNKYRRKRTIWFFYIDLLPISNEDFKKIRIFLINKNIVDGVYDGWNY